MIIVLSIFDNFYLLINDIFNMNFILFDGVLSYVLSSLKNENSQPFYHFVSMRERKLGFNILFSLILEEKRVKIKENNECSIVILVFVFVFFPFYCWELGMQ